jgi:hypothetical protein
LRNARRSISLAERENDILAPLHALKLIVPWFVVLAGCKAQGAPSPPDASTVSVAHPRAVTTDASLAETASARDAGDDSRPMSRSTSTTILAADAGVGTCKLLRPALMQTFGGPAAIRFLHPGGTEIAELVFNDAGHPQFSDAPPLYARALRDVPMPPKTTLPGCAVAGDVVYCPDATGAIHRTRGSGDGDTIVARSRPGTAITAAPVGDENVVLAYLREGTTSEGAVREAMVTLNDGPPVRLSEDGSGATSIELVERGYEIVALSFDARVAMTPTHARILRLQGGKLELGRDAVVCVGGPAERHTTGTLAFDKEGLTFALVAVSNAAEAFGMAAVRLSRPPTEDEPVAWSLYPNGLDPAALAASRGVSPIRVARVRPSAPEVDASHVLEVGELDLAGVFLPKCILSEAAYIKDVKLEIDRKGAMWIFWRDTRGSHFERRALP